MSAKAKQLITAVVSIINCILLVSIASYDVKGEPPDHTGWVYCCKEVNEQDLWCVSFAEGDYCCDKECQEGYEEYSDAVCSPATFRVCRKWIDNDWVFQAVYPICYKNICPWIDQ